jgi:hypothetical protein
MASKIALLLPITLGLAACNVTARVSDDTRAASLRAENRGVVILHTSMHDEGCSSIDATLA